MSGNSVVVTGASGFTGKHACKLLANKGWEVTAAGSPRCAPDFWQGSGAAQGERCDLTDGNAVMQLIDRVRPAAVLHLAGQNAVGVSWSEPSGTLAANVTATVNVFEAIRGACPECRVVVAGSALRPPPERLGETRHPYAFSKALQALAAALWHRWYGLRVIVAEPSNLIGPGGSAGICGKIARWAARADAGIPSGPFALSSLAEERDYMDVRDAAAAYEWLLREGQPGEVYAVESGVMRSLAEVKQAFEAEAESKLAWEVGCSDAPSQAPRDTGPIRALGWRPRIPFRQSVREALEEERRRLRLDGIGNP